MLHQCRNCKKQHSGSLNTHNKQQHEKKKKEKKKEKKKTHASNVTSNYEQIVKENIRFYEDENGNIYMRMYQSSSSHSTPFTQ